MSVVINERMTVEAEHDLVIFLIGMRINRLWKVNKWLPMVAAMPRMLKELSQQPELGLLGYRLCLGFPVLTVIEYWRSYEQLEAYAHSKNAAHLPAWTEFNRRVGTGGDAGIWHETYRVPAHQYEAIYANMPPFGLGSFSMLVPAVGYRKTAAGRMKRETTSAR